MQSDKETTNVPRASGPIDVEVCRRLFVVLSASARGIAHTVAGSQCLGSTVSHRFSGTRVQGHRLSAVPPASDRDGPSQQL